jgi:hypothetical protein
MDFFFFGNLTDSGLTAEISFCADFGKRRRVELWNPHTTLLAKIHLIR